jgi:hypothetical protein
VPLPLPILLLLLLLLVVLPAGSARTPRSPSRPFFTVVAGVPATLLLLLGAGCWRAAMASADQVAPAMLSHFFVYNPMFGPTDETEQDKLLFYYPADLPMDQKLRNVGLSEALVNFTRCVLYRERRAHTGVCVPAPRSRARA